MSKELAQGQAARESAGALATAIYSPAALQPVASLNLRFLHWLRASRDPKYSKISELLRDARSGLNVLADASPFLLCDARFRDVAAWRAMLYDVKVVEALPAVHIDPPRSLLLHSTCVLAWYAARRWPLDAPVLLGAVDELIPLLQSLDLHTLHDISQAHSDWLTPRWNERPDTWQQLVEMAEQTGLHSFGKLRARALQLFLGDLIR